MAVEPEPELGAEIAVEVVYLSASQQWLKTVQVQKGVTAREAVELSGVLAAFVELDPGNLLLGIYGARVEPDQVLSENDRVEVYRPLQVDPKEARRRRAARG